jgi:hypothetical protein
MATKKVERLGTPRTAPLPSPLKGKASDTKDRLIDLTKGAASGSRAIKGDNSPESTAPFKGVCPTKPHVPNAKTIKAIRESDAGENMTRYENVEEMLKDLEG